MATITLDQSDPKHGDVIHLTVDYDEDELLHNRPLACLTLNVYKEDGEHVYSAFTGLGWSVYPPEGNDFELASNSWPDGGGTAKAEFFAQNAEGSRRGKTLAELEFTVGA